MEWVPHGGAAREREEEWAGEAVQAPAEDLERRGVQERAQARVGNVFVPNAGPPSLIKSECPATK